MSAYVLNGVSRYGGGICFRKSNKTYPRIFSVLEISRPSCQTPSKKKFCKFLHRKKLNNQGVVPPVAAAKNFFI